MRRSTFLERVVDSEFMDRQEVILTVTGDYETFDGASLEGGTSTTSGCSTSSFETGLAAGALLFPRHMACGFTHALSSCAYVVRRFDPPQVDFTVKRWRECWVRGVTVRWMVRYAASDTERQRYRIGRPVRYPDGRTKLELIFQILSAHFHTFPFVDV